MHAKKEARLRRSKRGRMKMRELGAIRLVVTRSPRHIYAQIIVWADQTSKVLASASTLEKTIREQLSNKTSNKAAASFIGKLIAERAKSAGVETVAFDRSGFRYHGRIQVLADAAREAGLKF